MSNNHILARRVDRMHQYALAIRFPRQSLMISHIWDSATRWSKFHHSLKSIAEEMKKGAANPGTLNPKAGACSKETE